ncbi:hypothetical protein CVIRNUC_000554 [Coccomyxa viridis]|uniref:Exportin-1/Importin-beta-like domain-containing protein n=1 Tax=Coccomyxa viridis TaxID=1274662 RepID=A0AAV1HTH7_9CHLO|nr:hypothetical protein CVIRNUC_000554 [Coccomyxa viridis]
MSFTLSVDAILAPNTSEDVTVFAAQSLLRKVQKQFNSLPKGDRPALFASLEACLHIASQRCAAAVSPLAVALAAAIVQWPEWDGSLEQIGSRLSALPMLHLVAALPAEAQNEGSSQGSLAGTESAPDKVLSWGSIVLGWLHMTAQHSAADQRALIIEAFAAWVRLGLLYEQNLPSQEVQGLLNLTFQCLLDSSESDLATASSAAIDVAEQTPEQLHPYLLPAVMPLYRLAEQAAAQGDSDRASRLCTAFAAYCSNAMLIWVSDTPQGAALRAGLLACAKLDSEDLPVTGEPIAAPALAAWTYLADFVHSLEAATKDEGHAREESLDAEHFRRVFVEYLTSLLPLLGKPSYNGADSKEDPVAASPLAASAKDCLQAVCNLLGPQAYIGIAAPLFLHSQSTGIDSVRLAEGVLFAVHAAEDMISDFLGAEEGPKGAAGQQAAAGMLLQILQKSAGMHAEVPKQAAIPLGIAILDPLCQLITSMLGLMHSQPAAAQGLLLSSLNLAARCSQEPKLARLAASCIERACEGAVTASVDIPQDVIFGLVQAIQAESSDADVQQGLVLALAHCLSISSNADLQQQMIAEVLKGLAPACHHLQSLHQSKETDGATLRRASSAAVSAFGKQRALLHQAGTYHGQGGALGEHMAPLGEPSERSLARRVVARFGSSWTSMQAVLRLPCPGVAELREIAARCCTLAMRADRRMCVPIVASSAAMQASLLTAPGGSYFSSPLSVALSSYMDEPQCRAALLDALMSLAASPDIQRLAQPAAPDQQPETALAVLTVTTAAARAMSADDAAECRLVTQSLPLVAACLTAHCKELPATALSCLDALLEAAQIQSPVREVLLAALYTSASLLLAAVLRALVTPFGIGRVHKAACVLCHLHMLAAAQQGPRQASAWLQSLLRGVVGSLQQEGYVEQDVAQRLCTDMQQALDSLQEASGGPVEAGRGVVTSAGGRQVKKALRNFADAHQGSS